MGEIVSRSARNCIRQLSFCDCVTHTLISIPAHIHMHIHIHAYINTCIYFSLFLTESQLLYSIKFFIFNYS